MLFLVFLILAWIAMAVAFFAQEVIPWVGGLLLLVPVLVAVVAGFFGASWGISGVLAGVAVSEVNLLVVAAVQWVYETMHPVTELTELGESPGIEPPTTADVIGEVLVFVIMFAVAGAFFGGVGAELVPADDAGSDVGKQS